jgi:hypothetical protein
MLRFAMGRPSTLLGLLLLAPGLGVGCHRSRQESTGSAKPEPAQSAQPTPTGSAASTAPRPVELGCPDVAGPRELSVTWSKVSRAGGCFFFSGPVGLGRDTQLGDHARWEQTGTSAALVFGPARFVGDTSRKPVVLARSALHDFHGPWRITETIVGSWTKPAPLAQTIMQGECPEFEGTYAYQECNEGNAAECPGRCTISAQIRLSNRQSP